MKTEQRGFTALEVVLTIVAVLAIALAGYYAFQVWENNANPANQHGGSPTPQATVSNSPKATPASPTPLVSTALVSAKGVNMTVTAPLQGAVVASPVRVTGEVPGSWSFEGQFPVQVRDRAGKVLGSGTAKLSGDWQTDKLVPFTVNVTFSGAMSGEAGTVVLMKDNPSGLSTNDDSVSIPVKFK